MTLAQFKLLNKEKRYLLWLAKAIEIAFYEKSGYYFVLYQLGDFYIEMRILKLFPGNTRMVAFADGEKLDPYLQRVDISEIAFKDFL